jgi:DNA-binding NarL/FixJ family response regulator
MKLYLQYDPNIEIVGEASNGREGVDQVERLHPDVVIMDLLMPVMDGISAIREIKTRFPDVEVLALTSVLEDRKVIDAMQAGAMGYLLKDTDATALTEAIHATARGEVRLHPEAARRLVREVQSPSAHELGEPLTPREQETLRLLAQGASNKGIARELGVEERTAKAHVSNLMAKLGVKSRTQAALYAMREGLV